MGGDALPFPTQRLTPARHSQLIHRLLPILSAHYRLTCSPPACPGKASHGDVDVLVAGPMAVDGTMAVDGAMTVDGTVAVDGAVCCFDPMAVLGSKVVVRNGGVTSFEYESHQVDVIVVSEAQYDSARLFYSYGDVGMIVGMVLARVGVKFGYAGLSLVRHHTQLHLSSDRTRILAWLSMSESEWLAGFADEQAVFQWLCTCRWFRPSMFARDDQSHWNSGNRRALSNRPMLAHFIQHVHALPAPASASSADDSEWLSVEAVQSDAIAFFGCEAAVAALDAAVAMRAALKQRWNGVLVAGRTGLAGKELGLFMALCRRLVTDEELVEMDVEEVERFIDESFAKHGREQNDGAKAEREESKVNDNELTVQRDQG